MSTLRVDKIEPYLSSSIDIVGFTAAAGGATTGSNIFIGNQTVTGSIDITGQFLVNGTPITGSGGGSVDTASLATTGSNVFFGNQNINGTLAVTASGTEFKVNNDGTVDVTSTNGFNIIGNVGIVSGGLNLDGGVTASVQTNDIQATGGVLNIGAGSGAILFMGGNKLEVSGSIDANGNITGNNIDGNTISGQAVSASNGFSGDGSGISNVNAVTLDGLDSTDFAKTGSSNTFYAAQSVSNGAGNTSNITPLIVSNVDTSGGMGQTKNITLSANPSTLGGPLSGWTQPTLYGIGNAGPYQIAEFQSQGNYTDGTVSFKKSLVVTGSISLTDKIESAGNIILKPDVSDARYLNVYNTAAQDTHITASGGYLFLGDDTTYVMVDNYGSGRKVYITADNGLAISGSTTITGSVDITGDFLINGVPITGSGGSIDTGSFATTGSNEFVGKQGVTGSFEVTGSSTFNGDTIISTIDNLPGGAPGQIAFQGGKMWVYISGQWNEVQFVSSPPPPSSFEFTMAYDVSDSGSACNGSPSQFYSDSASLEINNYLWTGPGLATKVSDGYYASESIWYQVTGGDGQMTTTGSCPSYYTYSFASSSVDAATACSDYPASASNYYSSNNSLTTGNTIYTDTALTSIAANNTYYSDGTNAYFQTGDAIDSTTAC